VGYFRDLQTLDGSEPESFFERPKNYESAVSDLNGKVAWGELHRHHQDFQPIQQFDQGFG